MKLTHIQLLFSRVFTCKSITLLWSHYIACNLRIHSFNLQFSMGRKKATATFKRSIQLPLIRYAGWTCKLQTRRRKLAATATSHKYRWILWQTFFWAHGHSLFIFIGRKNFDVKKKWTYKRQNLLYKEDFGWSSSGDGDKCALHINFDIRQFYMNLLRWLTIWSNHRLRVACT